MLFRSHLKTTITALTPPTKINPIMDAVIPKRPTREPTNSSLIEPSQKEDVICRIFKTTGSCSKNCPNKAGHVPPKSAKEKYLSNLLRKFLQAEDTGIPVLSDNSAATVFCEPCDKKQDTPSTSTKKPAALKNLFH